MAERRCTVSEVVEGLWESNFEDSDNKFDGYLDMDMEDEGIEERVKEETVRVVEESMGVDGGSVVEESAGVDADVGAS